MATIKFYTRDIADNEYDLTSLGYGLGFFRTSFGTSVPVSEDADVCYITNSNGTYSGEQTQFVEFTHTNSGQPYPSSSGCALTSVPNKEAPLNPRFEHGSAVRVTNVKFRIYDRSNIDNEPSGMTTLVAEIAHPATGRTPTGSGSSAWETCGGSGDILELGDNPGSGGETWGQSGASGTRHDWYVAIVPSPDAVGSKTFAGYMLLEYL